MTITGSTVAICLLALYCLSREFAFLKLRRRVEAIEGKLAKPEE